MYACLAVTCHLHFWQNDRDFLRATVVTRGWNGYRNKSQHRKSTLEKKILPPFQQGFEPATFQSRVRCSNHWAILHAWPIFIYIYNDLVPKGAHARGYALQLKIKHCWKLVLFKMLCCVLAWMNEHIVQIISATRLWLISRYSHHTLKKRRKMTAKNGHPCTELFLSLCLQTNRKHTENQSLICTRKTSFYTDNITSTLTIVVFSINWSRMFALYVRQMCCKLKLKILNNRKTTASLRNHRKRRVCSDPCICTTQRYSFFFSEVLHEIWRIFPRSFDIVVISDVPTR